MNSLFNTLANPIANVVLPVPGGPTKHRIGELISDVFFLIAINSNILSLTCSYPKWYLSKFFLTFLTSNSSLEYLFQGKDKTVSK